MTESACSTAHIDADLALIGFGKGAETLAATLGRQGWRVAMIEQSAQMDGGTCINIGCVPTKSLVYQAEQLTEGSATTDAYRQAVSTEQAVTSKLRAENFKKLKFGRTPAGDYPTESSLFPDDWRRRRARHVTYLKGTHRRHAGGPKPT
jgi:choline dehydrogenase-like flavoprotein